MEQKIIEGFLQLGSAGLLGLIFYFIFKRSDARLDSILANSEKERNVWHQTMEKQSKEWRESIKELSANVRENTSELRSIECMAYVPKRKLKDVQ